MTDPTMRAAVFPAANAPSEVRAVPKPVAGPGQVLVRVHASGVNPLDTKIRAGAASHARQPLPAVLGIDVAGRVDAVGEGVTSVHVGDEVYGMVGGVGGAQGTLAEYVVADAELVAPKPRNLSARDAASLPLAIITAWEGLVDHAHAKRGDRVLVQGGAGGVGQVVVQLAQARGATAFAFASAADAEFLRARGVTPIDYQTRTAEDAVRDFTNGEGFDVVYDTVGGKALDASFVAVRVRDHVVSALGWGTHALAPLSFRSATYSGVFTLLPLLTGKGRARHGEILREAARLIEDGKILPRVDPRRFGLDTVDAAYAAVGDGSAEGKVVVDVGG